MIDDGEEYAYEYDAQFQQVSQRLVRIRNRSMTDLRVDCTYYGNGHRVSSHPDTNLGADVARSVNQPSIPS